MLRCHLLELPREIRDQILEHAISHYQPAPRSPEDVADRVAESEEFAVITRFRSDGIRWQQPKAQTSPAALLQASRQLREETLAAIERVQRTIGLPSLDVMVIDEDEVWPTWTNVGPLRKDGSVETLEVTLRQFGITKSEHSGWEEEPGMPTWYRFGALLELLLSAGWSAKIPRDQIKTYGTINIRALTPSGAHKHGLLPDEVLPHNAPEYRRAEQVNGLLRPTAIATAFRNWAVAFKMANSDIDPENNILNVFYHLGRIVHHIGYMRFWTDSTIFDTVEMGGETHKKHLRT